MGWFRRGVSNKRQAEQRLEEEGRRRLYGSWREQSAKLREPFKGPRQGLLWRAKGMRGILFSPRFFSLSSPSPHLSLSLSCPLSLPSLSPECSSSFCSSLTVSLSSSAVTWPYPERQYRGVDLRAQTLVPYNWALPLPGCVSLGKILNLCAADNNSQPASGLSGDSIEMRSVKALRTMPGTRIEHQ